MKPIKSRMERYIDITVEKAVDETADKAALKAARITLEEGRVQFKVEIKHDRELMLEGFRSEIKTMGETIDLRIREVTRGVIREEVSPRFDRIETRMDMFTEEMRRYCVDTDNFIKEMYALRLDTNRHDKRLARLEHARA